jgi:hypothetical protein
VVDRALRATTVTTCVELPTGTASGSCAPAAAGAAGLAGGADAGVRAGGVVASGVGVRAAELLVRAGADVVTAAVGLLGTGSGGVATAGTDAA